MAYRTPPYQKSMSSYESFAWNDAASIALLIADTVGDVAKARELYESLPPEAIEKFAIDTEEFIGEFIGKTESQRIAYINKTTKTASEKTTIVFLVLCLNSVLRVKKVLECRDVYRNALAPGLGNRVTLKALFEFSNEIAGMNDLSWPREIFIDLDLDDGFEPSIEDEPEFEPVAPPVPTPAPSKPEHELILQYTQSKRYTTDGLGRITPMTDPTQSGIWRLVAADQVAEVLIVSSMDRKLSEAELACAAKSLLDYEIPGRETILVVPSKRLRAVLSSEHVDRLWPAKPGVGQRAFKQWLDDYLLELHREMALIHEPLPTVNEFLNTLPLFGSFRLIKEADPSECNATKRRKLIARQVIEICTGRNRPLPVELSISDTPRTILDEVTDDRKAVGRAIRRLESYESSDSLTDFGSVLLEVGLATQQWRESPDSLAAHAKVIGKHVVQFAVANGKEQSLHQLRHDIGEVTGSATASDDLVAYSVFSQLRLPIPAAWIKPISDWSSPDLKRGGFYAGFWVSVQCACEHDQGLLRSIPYHSKVSAALNLDSPSSVRLRVARDLFGVESLSSIGTDWITRMHAWPRAIDLLLSSILSIDNSRPKSALLDGDVHNERKTKYLLIVAHADRLDEFHEIVKNSDLLLRILGEACNEQIQRAGLKNLLKFGPDIMDFSGPYILASPRLSMMFS